MATKRRGVTVTEEDKRKLQKMADKGLIRYKDLSKAEKKKRIAKVLRERQAKSAATKEAAKQKAATKKAEDKKKMGVGQRAPKESAAKLAERRRRFRASAKGFRKEEMSKLKKETAAKVAKEVAVDVGIGILTAPLGGPIAKVLSKGAQMYVRSKGGRALIKGIGGKTGQKAIDWIEREAKRFGGSAAKETGKKAGNFKLKKGGRKPIAQRAPRRPGSDRQFTATGSGASKPKPKPKVDFAPASKSRVGGRIQGQRSAPGKREFKINPAAGPARPMSAGARKEQLEGAAEKFLRNRRLPKDYKVGDASLRRTSPSAGGRTFKLSPADGPARPMPKVTKPKTPRAEGRPNFRSQTVTSKGRAATAATKGTPKFGRRPYGKGPTAKPTTGKKAAEFLSSKGKATPKTAADRVAAARGQILKRRVPGSRPGQLGSVVTRAAPKTAAEARKILKAAGVKGYTSMTGPQAIKAATNITRSRRLASQGRLPRKPKVTKAAAPAKPATPRVPGGQVANRTIKLAKSRTFATGKAAKDFLTKNGVNASKMGAEQAKKVASNLSRAKKMAKEGRLPQRPAPKPRTPKPKAKETPKAAKPAEAPKRQTRKPAEKPAEAKAPQAKATKKASAPKVSPRVKYQAKVDKMKPGTEKKPGALRKEFAKMVPGVDYRNPERARELIMNRYSKVQRAAKGKKGTPRPERRNQPAKAKPTETAPAPRARRARRGKAKDKAKDKGPETKKAAEPRARNTKASRRLSGTIEKFADGRIGYDKMVNIINKSKDKIAKLSGEQKKQFTRSMRRLGEISRLKRKTPSDAAEAKRHAKTISQMLAALGVISVASA